MTTASIPNPTRIETIAEISEVLARLAEFEKINETPAAIVMRQNLSLGASYDIISLKEVRDQIGILRGRELYVKFWDKQYFTELRKQYQ